VRAKHLVGTNWRLRSTHRPPVTHGSGTKSPPNTKETSSSPVRGRMSVSASAASAKAHTTLCVVEYSARQSPSQNGRGQLGVPLSEARRSHGCAERESLIPCPGDQEILTSNWGGSGCPLQISCERSSRLNTASKYLFKETKSRSTENTQIRCSKLSSLSH
jgi:hypothetical protein